MYVVRICICMYTFELRVIKTIAIVRDSYFGKQTNLSCVK